MRTLPGFTYTYDANGNRAELIEGSRKTRYEYDANNRLGKLIAADGSETRFAYDAVGNRTGITHASGAQSHYRYNDANQLTEVEHLKADGSLLAQFSYTLDANGRKQAVTEKLASGQRQIAYQYDKAGRLLEEQVDEAGDIRLTRYRYDAVGNRLSQQVTQGGSTLTTRYQYDSNDRLLSEDSDGRITTYSWDANGNLLKKQIPDGNSITYGWDSNNRLILVDTGSQKTEYERDAQGQRIKTRVTFGGKTVETQHLIDEARPYAEVVLDSTGSSQTRYLHTPDGLGELIAEQSGNQTRLYHADGQGSTRLVTDPAQSIQEILSFDAFGKRTDAFGQSADALSAIHHQYVGEYADHTGLYNLRARHYDPQVVSPAKFNKISAAPNAIFG